MIYNKQRKDGNGETYKVSNREEKENNGKQVLIKKQVTCTACTLVF